MLRLGELLQEVLGTHACRLLYGQQQVAALTAARWDSLAISLLTIPVTCSIARGAQWLNCSMYSPSSRALSNSAIASRVLWNQLPELIKETRDKSLCVHC